MRAALRRFPSVAIRGSGSGACGATRRGCATGGTVRRTTGKAGRITRRRARAVATWVFDLDNTLYPASSNLFAAVERRMAEFVADFLGVGAAEANRIRRRYFRQYGTTLRGLMANHGVDPDRFLDFVHDIDLAPLVPSPRLDEALSRLAGRKLVFTNAPLRHVRAVLGRLGVEEHFPGVFDLAAAGYLPKPEPAAYEALVRRFRFDPSRAVMVDDVARNLLPAAALGMATVWVRSGIPLADGERGKEHIHHEIDDLVDWLDGGFRDAVPVD